MTLNELMAQLAIANVKLSTRDGELSVVAAKGSLTPALTAELRRFKPEIIALLAPAEAKAAVRAIVPDPARSYEPFPFSDLQVGFYMAADPFMEYHVQPHYYCETDVAGLDVARYEAALNKAWIRHRGEIVLVSDDRHLSALADPAPLAIAVNDLRALPSGQARAQLLELREQLKREEQPLDRWPWFDLRVSLWREDGAERARIHFNHNNFYSDGYGAMVLQREIDRFYADPQLQAEPLELTFRDAVLGLEELSCSPAGERARSYWLDRLEALPEPPPLPQRPDVNRRCRSRLQRREGTLAPAAWQQFKEHAARFGLTPTSAVICAYAEVLCAWSGSQHFILSNMVTRRLPLHPDIGQMIGNFASLYPLEVDLRGELTFAARAQRLQQQILRDSDHREWGGMQVMQAFNRLKGEFGSVPCPFVVGSGLFLDKFRKADFSCLETAQTIFDHQFWELEDGSYYYVWDLLEEFFPDGMIAQMWQALGALLEQLAATPAAWETVRLALAPPAVPAADLPVAPRAHAPQLLQDALHARAASHPQQIAVRSSDGALSYRALCAGSAAVARMLASHGVAPNELVALVMDRGAPLAAAALGILQAGAAYVPIDPKLPAERLRYMLENSAARVVLVQEHYRDLLDWPAGVAVLSVGRELFEAPDCDAGPALQRATDLAYVIYTSGSTGNPKGVMIDHRAALNTVIDINDRFGVDASDVVFGVSSFSFDLSVYDLFGVLDAGATLVYPDPQASLNPAHWLELMALHRVTVWNSAPPLMNLLVETARRRQATLPDLRLVMLSGDWIAVDLPDAIRAVAPNAVIVSLGGATEAAVWSIYYPIGAVDPQWSSIPYGRALSNQGWQVRDSQGRQCPAWITGDLFITGVGLAQGYWADPVKTAASFIVDADSGERLYRTGDRGRYAGDGNIEFMGRADSQVKVQGHRIELGEIDAALNAHPDVKEAVVLAVPVNVVPGTPVKPNHPKQLQACVVWKDGVADSARREQLRAYLALKLPAHMVPASWLMLERMPISHNGKLDRKALALLAPAAGDAVQRHAHVAPRGDTERRLAAIWEGVLQRSGLGVHDDFFDLGGQSVDAVRCVALIQEGFARSLSLGDIWQTRTIEKLALRLEQRSAERGELRLVDIEIDKPGRPVFFVHPAGGQVTGYFALAQQLARPSYGLVALEQDVASDSLATIELIAARYVSQLRQVQAHGPYTLAGWSSGGCIAYDMALQLERMGEQVDRVFLIDCPAPLMHERIAEIDMLRGFAEDLALHLPIDALDGKAWNALEGRALYDAVFAHLQQASGRSIAAADLYPFYRVFKRVVDAVRLYRPGHAGCGARLHVVRAADGEVSEFAGHPFANRVDWGWAELGDAAIDSVALPGTHHTLLQAPNLAAVGAVFARAFADTNVAQHAT